MCCVNSSASGTVTKQVTNTDINDNESDNQFEFRENVQS